MGEEKSALTMKLLPSDFDEKLGYVSGEDPPGVGESRGGQKRCSACKIFSFAW